MIPTLFLLAELILALDSPSPGLVKTVLNFFRYDYASPLENHFGFIVLVLVVFLICILAFKLFKKNISLSSVLVTFFAILGLIVLIAGIFGVKDIWDGCIPSFVGPNFSSLDCNGPRNYWPALNSVIAGIVFIVVAFVVKFFKKKI
jgi:Co/Zn/Cd efflux system component